ncbi:hypothetical protein HC028_21435 [Planosporangium flavigriseum]|uniref:Uncharacterized protein n=1 Tax=Planosporangium flavigriseum TaxID=373681 RepID=A0A8J3M3H1_9ACTN|nr:hypothetical protein [Planosporangium flavigriseum]NJC67045.1 hypothetical protein [Planosporangium flavigriseum]GIG76170.1 hypothetical protein Pfl04_45740 [Planosporangium flavigriseum]
MAGKTDTDPVEPLLEELIKEIMTSTGSGLKSASPHEDAITAALTEAATVSLSRTLAQASGFDRVLLVGALAPALADALAPALAKALVPEIITALSQITTVEQAPKQPVTTGNR